MRSQLWLGLAVFLAAPVLAQSPDTSLYTPRSEFRAGVSSISLKRAVSMPGLNVGYSNASLIGLEFLTMGANGGGLRLRYESGTDGRTNSLLAGGKIQNVVGHLIMGRREFALVGGYRLSSFEWSGKRQFHMPELGLEGGKYLAGAGILVKGSAMYSRMFQKAKLDSVVSSGIEARTSVLYVPPKGPVYVELGYRREVSSYKNPNSAIVRREEASAEVLSIVLQSGLSVR